MRLLISSAIVGLLAFGCGGDDAPSVTSDASTDARATRACTWPTPAASCTPQAGFRSCGVPNGARVEADGAVVDATGKPIPGACKNLCESTDYSLTCGGDDPASPALTASLGCTLVNTPTPYGVTIWCCPCTE